MNKKKVVMVMPHMVGGGAERVAAQIMNKLNERGYDTRFILTSAKKNEVVRSDLNEKTPLILLTEEMKAETSGQKLAHLSARAYSTILGKLCEKQGKFVPASVGKATIEWQYHREITWLRNYLQQNPDMTVIVFLQPSIPMVLLAAQGLPNKVIISERADPNRLMKKRYGKPFIEKYYTRADAAVFQTEDAKSVYPEAISKKGTVIFNPLKDNLPQPYHGERDKYITTFCRISNQKNLPLLVEAFSHVHNNVVGNKRTGASNEIPKLGNNVNVGFGAMIIGNVEIADNCVIGAGAVVTKSFTKPGGILVGVPARDISKG